MPPPGPIAASWPEVAYRGVVRTRRCRAPLEQIRSLCAALWVLAAVAAASACADTGDGPLLGDEPAPDTTEPTTAETPPAETPPEDTSPLEVPPSEGMVEIGDAHYQFAVTCEERGAGEVVVIGAGDDPVSGGLVELYLRAALGDPYVGLRLADQTLIEPSLDSTLDLYLQDDVIRASAIRFVKDLDLETGAATEVGFGELEIHCYEYANELPG